MKIKFYINNSRFDRLNKNDYLTNEKTIDTFYFKSKEDTNDLTIQINDKSFLKDYNYCYIEELKSYYFIVSKTVINNSIIELTLHNDLLMTFKDKLLEQDCIISRQEKVFDAYLNDDTIQVESYERIQTRLFPNGFSNSDASFILVVCGGKGAITNE